MPVLGLCYGMQWMAHAYGGAVKSANGREYGRAVASLAPDEELFAGLEPEQTVWMNHGESVEKPPPGYRVTITASRYSLGTTIAPSVVVLNRCASAIRSAANNSSPEGPTAPKALWIGP